MKKEDIENNIEKIIQDIYQTNNIEISKDDPILIIYTLNKHLIKDFENTTNYIVSVFIDKLNDVLEEHKEQISRNLLKEGNHARNRLLNIINDYFEEKIKIMQEEEKKEKNVMLLLESYTKKIKILLFTLIAVTSCNILFIIFYWMNM